MNEGWCGDDHLLMFDESEIDEATRRYGAPEFLPGYQILGLSGWDDFIVRDSVGRVFKVPTLPFDANYLSPYTPPHEAPALLPAARFRGRVKWYTQPILFGGDPNAPANLIWVDHATHAQLVKWWNEQYRAVRGKAPAL